MADKKPSKNWRQSALSQLRSPLVFFGLSLFVVESAFGGCLLKYSYSERAVVILSGWMGGIFVLSILAVTFLTWKVPSNIVVEASSVRQDLIDKDLSEAREHAKRVREAVAFVLTYKQQGGLKANDPSSLLTMLGEVERILSPAQIGSTK